MPYSTQEAQYNTYCARARALPQETHKKDAKPILFDYLASKAMVGLPVVKHDDIFFTKNDLKMDCEYFLCV